jgi:hypothetical protein
MKKYLLIILAILSLVSCRNIKYVPVESLKTEYRDVFHRDSIFVQDSIYVYEKQRGDTIFIGIEKYSYLYRDKLIRDSVFIQDSIKVPYPVEVIKEVKRGGFQNWHVILMCIGSAAIAIVIYKIIGLFRLKSPL